jgi:Zn-dependent oligopeptidase
VQPFLVKKMKKFSMLTVFPRFHTIDPNTLHQQLEDLLNTHRKELALLLKNKQATWENFIEPLQQLNNQLEIFWSPIEHLHTVHLNKIPISTNATKPLQTATTSTRSLILKEKSSRMLYVTSTWLALT